MPRKCKILSLPIKRARETTPGTVRLDYDSGEWCVVQHVGAQHESGLCLYDLDEARAAIALLVENGFEELPPSEAAIAAGARS